MSSWNARVLGSIVAQRDVGFRATCDFYAITRSGGDEELVVVSCVDLWVSHIKLAVGIFDIRKEPIIPSVVGEARRKISPRGLRVILLLRRGGRCVYLWGTRLTVYC